VRKGLQPSCRSADTDDRERQSARFSPTGRALRFRFQLTLPPAQIRGGWLSWDGSLSPGRFCG
jgi:hypothetical protein